MNATLTARQARFVDEFLVDCNGAAAAVRAGYSPGSAKVAAHRLLTKDNRVKQAVEARQSELATHLGMQREDVLQGLLEAVAMGREQGNPAVMISALREIARLLGYLKPEVKRVEVGLSATAERQRFEAMSDEELLAQIDRVQVAA